ncbi:MAG: F0F1 ATP synthase subunit A [Defluviitaleaceae bacterium]|nr:F0F1 ATP synthase subunit A [Defluviitaleaceae bacterium]
MFDVPIHGVVSIGPVDLWITNTIVVTWVVMAVLITFAIIVRIKLKKFTDKPTGFQNAVEMAVEAFDGLMKSNGHKNISWLGGWFFTLFTFLLFANIIGILPGMRPPTGDWPLPFALALTSFFLIQFAGIRYGGWKYIKGTYMSPHWAFFPINVLGEFSRPISLSFRLFGNILGGLILITLLYTLVPVLLSYVVPVALHLIFDLAFGVLQAFIFTILSLTFVSLAAAEN